MAENRLSAFTLKPPKWWKETGITASDDPSSFLRIANTLIPFMAPSEQTSVATFLGSSKDNPYGVFKDYLGEAATPSIPTPQANTDTRNLYFSSLRAREAVANLERMRELHGVTPDQVGPGYKFLTQALDLLTQYGGRPGEGMSRADYEQIQTGLEALTSQASNQQDLAPYADLAQKFIFPTTIGNLLPSATVGGRRVYGQASTRLFT